MTSDLLQRLNSWLTANSRQEPTILSDGRPYLFEDQKNAVYELRTILGEFMKEVNEASRLYKQSMRSPSRETSAAAAKIVDELENWDAVVRSLQMIKGILADDSKNIVRFSQLAKSISHAVHYLERARFSQEQVESIRRMATASPESMRGQDFPDEVNQEGMDRVFRNSIYNIQSGSQKTLKVIREVLQNAVDATDPNQKPQLKLREGWSPEIHISTSLFRASDGNYLMDVIVEDKGTGMDWDILSKKFFVTFESGKAGDKGAAGGFGIAKALIQDAPEHGWAIDTNGIHSGRFHKNVFLGTRRTERYEAPSTEIKKSGDGTTVTLHGLPQASSESIAELCRVYATNGRVKIFLNDKEQEPKFLLESEGVKQLGSDMDEVARVASDDEGELDVAKRILNKSKDAIREKMEEIGLVAGGKNRYKFYLHRTSGSGKLYVLVNGQFQFDEEKYMPRLDIIVSVETSSRPGDDDYPLDPGREYLRGNTKNLVNELANLIKNFAEEMSRDELFKDGIESLVVNEDEKPMTIEDEESTTEKKDAAMRILQSVTGGAFKEKEEEEERPSAAPQQESEPEVRPAPNADEDKIEKATKGLIDTFGGSRSPFSEDTIRRMVKDAVGSSDDRVEQQNKIKSIVEGLSTPGHILVQRNFVGKKAVTEDPKLTGEMLIVWQRAVKIIINKMTSVIEAHSTARSRPFVPGLIYSNEALGLFMPAKQGRAFDSICVNPITMAAYILPGEFRQKLEDEKDKDAFELLDHMDNSKGSSDTPTTRLAKFIFHVAVHEVCHFLYPDGYSPENFHRFITKIELVCHDEYEQIKREVKLHMSGLRKCAKKLIGVISRNKKTKVEESFSNWIFRRPQAAPPAVRSPRTRKIDEVEVKVENFRDFLKMTER